METINAANTMNAGNSSLFQSENSNVLGKEDFLTLLITQLENQDPLNPKDPSEFVAQLAQFSSLEQQITTNKNLEVIQGYQNSLESSMAIKYFGKEVVATGNAIEHEGGTTSPIHFSLPKDAMAINISMFDQAGNFVDNIEMGEVGAGHQSIEWDGKNANMDDAPSGIYLFEVQAIDYEENAIATETFIEGLVTGAKYNNGKIFLTIGEKIVPLSSVIEVKTVPEEELPPIDSGIGEEPSEEIVG